MGRAGHDRDFWRGAAHDGAVRCVLCARTGPGADHGWCQSAGCLVCDECCAALLEGDAQRFLSIAANTGRLVTPDALLQGCSACERGQRMFSERLLNDPLEDTPSC